MVSLSDPRVLLSILVLTITFWLGRFYWRRRHFFKLASRIPNSGKHSLFGLRYITKSIDERFNELLYNFRTSPEVFKFYVGNFMLVGISKPEHLELVLTNPSTINKCWAVEFTKPYMGDGLFSASEEIWKKHRKLINPVFNLRALNSFVPIFAEKCEILLAVLEKCVGQPDIDLMEKFSACTLDAICETAMGLNVDAQRTDNRYGKLLNRLMAIVTHRASNIILHPKLIFDWTKAGKTFQEMVTLLNGFSRNVITQKRTEFEQKMNEEYIEEKDNTKRKSLLDLLMEITYNGNRFTEKELQDEVNTAIAAGSDTTAAAMSFCCMTLGMFPEYQQKVYEEAIELLGEDRYPTKDDLRKLTFTEMFIKETLRIFPIAPLIVRIAAEDIRIDDLVIPKYSGILMGLLHLHRHPKYWNEPMKFNPYRFSQEEWDLKHPYSYLPFSGGPRNCIGQRYALMLMKVLLAKIVTKFRIKTGYKKIEDVKLKVNLMMRPTNGFKVTLELRE